MSREAALAALAAQQFDQVAPLLDTAELEVQPLTTLASFQHTRPIAPLPC